MIHLEHGFDKRVEVTTSNNENFSFDVSNLDGLEIVREVESGIDVVHYHCLGLSVVDIELLRVLLHYVDIKCSVQSS